MTDLARASSAQKAERLNRALVLLQQVNQLSDAVAKLARKGVLDFIAPSLSLSRTSSATERPCSSPRSQTGIYRQTSWAA